MDTVLATLLPSENKAELVRYWTLGSEDLRTIVSRRRPHNPLGFAVQLCALRYPGRLLRPGEQIFPRRSPFCRPARPRSRSARHYALRGPTRYEQLDALRDVFGFRQLIPTALSTDLRLGASRD